MAAKTNNENPLVTLKAEALAHLADIRSELERAEADIKTLEEIGLDTTSLREKLDWGKRAVDILDRHYGGQK